MLCPKCEGKTTVTCSRSTPVSVERRRKCNDCGTIFYTTEAALATSCERHYKAEQRYFALRKKEKNLERKANDTN